MPDPVKPAMLFSQMEPPAPLTDRFHEWYETDHIPARMALPGFRGARRFRALAGEPEYLAIYEMDSLAALESDAYLELKRAPSRLTDDMLAKVDGFTRFTCEQLSDFGGAGHGAFTSVVAFAVPEDQTAEFDTWYETEHVPMLLEAPDWLRVHRYRVISGDGGPWTRIAVHELANKEVMESPERARARQGPLRERLVGRDWFEASGRWLYEQISEHGGSGVIAPEVTR